MDGQSSDDPDTTASRCERIRSLCGVHGLFPAVGPSPLRAIRPRPTVDAVAAYLAARGPAKDPTVEVRQQPHAGQDGGLSSAGGMATSPEGLGSRWWFRMPVYMPGVAKKAAATFKKGGEARDGPAAPKRKRAGAHNEQIPSFAAPTGAAHLLLKSPSTSLGQAGSNSAQFSAGPSGVVWPKVAGVPIAVAPRDGVLSGMFRPWDEAASAACQDPVMAPAAAALMQLHDGGLRQRISEVHTHDEEAQTEAPATMAMISADSRLVEIESIEVIADTDLDRDVVAVEATPDHLGYLDVTTVAKNES